MNYLDEKLSALFDGELDSNEIESVLEELHDNANLQNKISMYSLMSQAFNDDSNISYIPSSQQLIEAKPLRRSYRFWFANVTTAAASILLTLFFMNFDTLSRMSVNEESSNQIASAVNSNEAKNIALRSEEYITDHIMKVINEPSYMRTDRKFDLRNVGYQSNYAQGYIYTKDKESFTLRVEKSNFGLTKIRYWKHENKMIYLVPISDGRLVTIYGNLSLNSAVQIAKSIK